MINAATPHSLLCRGDLDPRLFEGDGFEWLKRGKGRKDGMVRIRSLAVDELDLKFENRVQDWLELDEILVVLPPGVGLKWPKSVGMERMRILMPGVDVQKEDGWGDARLQNKFMRGLKWWSKRDTQKKGVSSTRKVEMPVVKIVQWGTLTTEEDPFCIPITPLSLRKDL